MFLEWALVLLSGFCVIFFIFSGVLLLLDIAKIREVRAEARGPLIKIFLGTILTGTAAAALYFFGTGPIDDLMEMAKREREQAISAQAQVEAVTREIENAESMSIVFVHRYQDTRSDDGADIHRLLDANGYVAPGVEGLDIKVDEDVVRYFHVSSEPEAKAISELTGIEAISYVPGYEEHVGPEHLEIWLKP